ncbi:hypothetical protein RQP46_004340 [Phenoliferia psychrophenolica]
MIVGSLPRPTYLQEAFAAHDAGKLDKAGLVAVQDRAAQESIVLMEEAGQRIVTDGEQRASSTLAGTGLMNGLVPAGQYFAIFDDNHHRQLPGLAPNFKGPFKYRTYAYEYLKLSKPHATHAMKCAVIAPSMLYLLYPLAEAIPGYSREQFCDDLVNECEKDIRGCFAVGAQRVSIDFTEGRLATKEDPRNPWTGAKLLDTFIKLNNRVLARFAKEVRVNIGIHTCPGGDCDSVHSAEVPYTNLLGPMFQMNAGYFLIQLASEEDKEKVYKEIGEKIRKDADGVKQVAFIGVTNPLNPRVETATEVCDALVCAAKYIDPTQLGSTDDCGFSPFSIDLKPKHGSPDFAREIAQAKIRARNEGTKMAAVKLGL